MRVKSERASVRRTNEWTNIRMSEASLFGMSWRCVDSRLEITAREKEWPMKCPFHQPKRTTQPSRLLMRSSTVSLAASTAPGQSIS